MAVLEYSRAVGVVLARACEAADAAAPPGQGWALTRAAWELLEACFVEQGRASGSMSQALVAWLKRNHGAACAGEACAGAVRRRVARACSAAPRAEEVPGFWRCS